MSAKMFQGMLTFLSGALAVACLTAYADEKGDAQKDNPATTDDSGLPKVEVLATDSTALEGTSSGAFTVIRSGNPTNSLEVHYTLSGTATNGVDYVQVKDATTIPVG